MGWFSKKRPGSPIPFTGPQAKNQQQSISQPMFSESPLVIPPAVSDLDEPPKPLFDQHKAALYEQSGFEKQLQEKLALPPELSASQQKGAPMFSFEDPRMAFPSPSEEKKPEDIPINFDVLLDQSMKQRQQEMQQQLQINPLQSQLHKEEQEGQEKASEETLHESQHFAPSLASLTPRMPQPPQERSFIPMVALQMIEEGSLSLKEDLTLSDDTLYRVDELNKLQFIELERWHLDLEYVDAVLNKVDKIIFSQKT